MNATDQVTILLVDDNPSKLLTYEAILESLGERLLKAGSAREALESLLNHEVAVVLIDVCMPELDGYELASMIREHPRCRKAAIIFVSAVLMTDLDRLHGYECGAVDYVPVPVIPEILRAKVGVFADLYRKTEQLERLNRDLERRVSERTAALEASSAELRENDRRKDEFLAMLAHELRGPLAPIRASLHLLRPGVLPPARRARMRDIIERQVNHLVELTDDLLNVSRLSRGMISLEKKSVDLVNVVGLAVEQNRALLDVQGHELRVEAPEEPITVMGDEVRLVQVFGNLLQNAAKFTKGAGQIRLTIAREDASAVVSLRDTGIGMPADMLEKVFDLFAQVDDSQEGLGIGLALVRQVVSMHGGTVQAFSDGPGLGTEVVVRLPASIEAAAPAPQVVRRPDAAESVARRRILVVDDNSDAAESLALLLQIDGHDVRTAFDGVEALDLAAGFVPDVMLLDIGMPRLDGYEVARRLRKQPWARDLALIALTGWGQEQDRRRTAEAGFNAHLIKPVGEAELRRAIAAAGSGTLGFDRNRTPSA
jgi:signal transduction histidine kinase